MFLPALHLPHLTSETYLVREKEAERGPNNFVVTVNIPQKTLAVIVLAQQDTRSFSDIDGVYEWSCDFTLFKKGDTEPIATSDRDEIWGRNVQLEIELDAGEYTVHVSSDATCVPLRY